MSATTSEPIEAVIISGARRGEIINLPASESLELRRDEIQALDNAIDSLNAVVQKVSDELQWTLESLRSDRKSA